MWYIIDKIIFTESFLKITGQFNARMIIWIGFIHIIINIFLLSMQSEFIINIIKHLGYINLSNILHIHTINTQ